MNMNKRLSEDEWGKIFHAECEAEDEISRTAQQITYFFASNRTQDLFQNETYVRAFRQVKQILGESKNLLVTCSRNKYPHKRDSHVSNKEYGWGKECQN